MPSPSESAHITPFARTQILWSLAVSAFWVIFLWGFWQRGPFALGMNAFVYLAATVGLFLWTMRRKGVDLKKNLFWIVPIGLVITSFLIYDNPFLKMTSLLALLALFGLFYNFGFVPDNGRVEWNTHFLWKMIARAFSLVVFVPASIRTHFRLFPESQKGNRAIIRVLIGVFLFALIALAIVIPLLSLADATFASRMSTVREWFEEFVSTAAVYKTLVAVLFSFITGAALLAWGKPFEPGKKEKEMVHIDSIVTGIVLGGILAIYLLFLWIQLEHIWVGKLPFDFKETEHLVKSGFWQLLFLTVLNIGIYFFTYRKTVSAVQKILAAFTIASLLLLISAGHRMALYVIYYGFSYEKFFASYTVLFCAILFVWLIGSLFAAKRLDSVKFLFLLFLWMYAGVTIFPVEQFILRSNVALAKREGSQIRLYELTMLSPDVLGTVKQYEKQGLLNERATYYAREQRKIGKEAGESPDWKPWIAEQEKILATKKWYEKNLMNLLQ